MSKKNKIIAVIPAYNEAATIARVVKDLRKSYKKISQVIVVDDGSRDNTATLARKAGAAVIALKKNHGYDDALNAGFAAAAKANAAIIFTYDADGLQQANDVKRVIKALQKKDADICVGIRNYKHRISEHLFALYSAFKIGVQDPLCGLKAYRIEAYRAVGKFDSIGSTGTELMFAAHAKGFKISELPINIRSRHDAIRFGQSLTSNYKILLSLSKIIFKYEGLNFELAILKQYMPNLSDNFNAKLIFKRFVRDLLKKL